MEPGEGRWALHSGHSAFFLATDSALPSPHQLMLLLPLHPLPCIPSPGGNNDTPFYKPDLFICVSDPHRVGHEQRYYPGDVCFR